MHEVAAMQGVMRAVLESLRKAGGKRVTNVQLILGASSHLSADAAYQLFEALAKGTPAENASLTIEWLPATYSCLSCQHSFESSEPSLQVICPKCGELALEIAYQDICAVSAIDIICDEEHEKVKEVIVPPVGGREHFQSSRSA
jgi:hydrogenase nickel incorporation protein HypA/HybF